MVKPNKYLLSKPSSSRILQGGWENNLQSKKIILYNNLPGQTSFYALDSYDELLKASKYDGKFHFYCENSTHADMICPYIDLDIYQHSDYDILDDINKIINSINLHFSYLQAKFFIKYCHGPTNHTKGSYKHSFHLIIRLFFNNSPVYVKNCKQAESLSNLFQIPADHDAYKNNLRLLYSNKCNKDGSLENRIFDIHPLSDFQDDPKMSLMSYCPHSGNNYYLLDELITKQYMISSVRSLGYQKDYQVSDMYFETINHSDCYCFYLTEQKCPERTHKSNNSSAMYFIDDNIFVIKCLDQECSASQTFRLSFKNFQITDFQEQQSSVSTKSRGSKSSKNYTQDSQFVKCQQLQSCSNLIQQFIGCSTAHRVSSIDKLYNCGFEAMGAPSKSKALQTILGSKTRKFTANNNKMTYELNGNTIDDDLWQELIDELKLIVKEETKQTLKQQNIITNNIINIGTLNINNSKNKEEKDDTIYDDDFDDFEFQSDTHREYFINIINDEFQFVPKLYNLDFPDQFIYVYDENDRGCPMYFDNLDDLRQNYTDGGFWNMQGGLQVAKQKIRNYIVKFFKNITNQLDKKDKYRKILQLKLKQIRSVIKNNNEFDQYLMETYFNKRIKFNNIPHYLHFKNGTFDLEQRKLIKTTPDMYNTFQIDYDFDENVSYNEIYQQLSQIMQSDEFDWFLKQLSNCLNPDKIIEEKQIVCLTGKGNNGKTVIFNLMNESLCLDAYSINGRSIMIQAPNTSSSNATPDTVKLIHKRFCYIAELDKNQSFNQQQVKILTGGEKIQARDLFKTLITFQPYSGIFISCNQLPYIDTSDGGFMNRLKVIDLKYQFVQNPSNQYQKPINKQLLRLIQTTQWKQGFINLLIETYYKKQKQLPQKIKQNIQQHINISRNPVHVWAENNIFYNQGTALYCEDIRQTFLEQNQSKLGKQKFTRQLKEYFDNNVHVFNNVNVDYFRTSNNNEKRQENAFFNVSFIDKKLQQQHNYQVSQK